MISPQQIPRLSVVELENVRGFRSLRLCFAEPESSKSSKTAQRQHATLIIGQNGTNKSTLLRAITLALASPTDAAAMLASETGSFVRRGADGHATIRAKLIDAEGRSFETVKHLANQGTGPDSLVDSSGPSAEDLNLLVCGYGATRGITGTDSGRDYRVFDSASTLFDYRRELLSPELVLRRLSDVLGPDRFQATLVKIARAMGLEGEAQIELGRGGGVTVSAAEVGERVPLEALADGYRVMFSWLIDVYGRALRRDWLSPDGSVGGLILVDEIDQHLHPELQTHVVPELIDLLPAAQYVLTTHSPLVALGAHPNQLVVLERDGTEVKANDRVPDYRGFSPEDVLSDRRLFATEARNPDLSQLIEHYDELVDVPPSQRSDEHQETLRKVARALREAPRPQLPDDALDEARAEIEALLQTSR